MTANGHEGKQPRRRNDAGTRRLRMPPRGLVVVVSLALVGCGGGSAAADACALSAEEVKDLTNMAEVEGPIQEEAGGDARGACAYLGPHSSLRVTVWDDEKGRERFESWSQTERAMQGSDVPAYANSYGSVLADIDGTYVTVSFDSAGGGAATAAKVINALAEEL